MKQQFIGFYHSSLFALGILLTLGATVFQIPVVAATPDVPSTQTVQLPTTRGLTVEEIRGTDVMLNDRPAQAGDRLQVGDTIKTGVNSTVSLRVDSNIGLVELAENTTVAVKTLSGNAGVSPNQTTVLSITSGRIRASVSRFVASANRGQTAERPSQEIAALYPFPGQLGEFAQDAPQSIEDSPFRIETPVTVAGVRGTSFGVNVGPDGKTGISTAEGVVGSRVASTEVRIEPGRSAVVNDAESPASTLVTPLRSELQIISLSRLGPRTVRLRGQVAPMDIIYVDNQSVRADAEGKFELVGRLDASRRLKVVVRGPSVRERNYTIPVH